MSQYNYDEKPKNDFEYEKSKNENYNYRERGGCLTVFLVFIIGMNIFFLFALCAQAAQLGNYSNAAASVMPILAVAFAIQCAVIACAVGIWNWQKWGYYGLAIAYVIQLVIMLLAGNMINVVSSIIGLVILVSLVNSKIEMFE